MEQRKQKVAALYDRFWKELYIVACRKLHSKGDVEDILHDIFLSLITTDVCLDDEQAIRSLLHLRLKSRIINCYRNELVRKAYKAGQALQSERDDDLDIETSFLQRELEQVILNEIDRMPDKMREIFVLSRYDMKSAEEIAGQLNISIQTVRNQISSGIRRVRTAVNYYQQASLTPAAMHYGIVAAAILLVSPVFF